MLRFGNGRSVRRIGAGTYYDAVDLSDGSLILDFVSLPPSTLELDFAGRGYRQWEADPSTPDLVGYYQVKG